VNVVIADILEPHIPEAVGRLSGKGVEVQGYPVDVRREDSVLRLADRTLSRFGRVDLLCNNAGVVCEQKPMWEQRSATWNWLIDVKLMGVVHGVRAFVPLMIERGTGHVLNTASAGGLMPLPTMTPYNATMHAVVGLTETLDVELRSVSAGLGATVLCPAYVEPGWRPTRRHLRRRRRRRSPLRAAWRRLRR
jgi:NAD(P)-dependent dehydrogenase (short-subunit alcohol dehydrogenase family)